LKSYYVLRDHYDDERDKIVLHNTTPRPKPQFASPRQDRFFGLRPVLS